MDDKQLEELMVQSFIKIMMETEKSPEGKAELAQAQSRAEQQKKDANVHLQLDSDGLHIKTDPENSYLPQQPHLPSPQQQQQFLSVPHQHHVPVLQQIAPQYPSHDPNSTSSNTAAYPTNPYPNSYTTSLPEFGRHIQPQYQQQDQTISQGPDPIPSGGNTINYPGSRIDNIAPFLFDGSDHNSRRRREGRDHTNYLLPPHLDLFHDKVKPADPLLATDGPPGLPLPSSAGDNETGLRLVVLDKTDDEDDNISPASYRGQPDGLFVGSGQQNVDVFPLDKQAIDRDMYKQVYDPSVDMFAGDRRASFNMVTADRRASLNTTGSIPATAASRNLAVGLEPRPYSNQPYIQQTYQPHNLQAYIQQPHNHSPNHSPGSVVIYHVTSPDSDVQTSKRTIPLGHDPQFDAPHTNPALSEPRSNKVTVYEQLPTSQITFNPSTLNQPVFSMSAADYERYTSNSSQTSSVREDPDLLPTERSQVLYQPRGLLRDSTSRTFLINPSTNPNKGSGKTDENNGFKFQVNKYNVVKRASILNRAERLLDARRGQYTDRSDSSDELERIDEHDDEDEDMVEEMTGPRHQALRHVWGRGAVYDDSTSYNSSDDVLNTIRYHPRGPVSQAARRARLTSVNARLNKHKRIRAARRQVIARPPPSSDGDNSSETDATDTPMPRRRKDEAGRYEDPTLLDDNADDNNDDLLQQQQPHHREPSPVLQGRRVMFFRNGDMYFKPRQVLINHKTYANLEKLLVDLSSMVETSTGVKYVFAWPEGREIKSITEFETGKYYVCSSTSRLQRVDYGSNKESHWKGGKIDRNEKFLFQKDGSLHSPLRRPRVLTVISNLARHSREKLFLNTNSQMNFEDILKDITNIINIPNPPVKALYTERIPHQKVESYSQLIRDFADHHNFIACGEEMVPLELQGRRVGQGVEMFEGPNKGFKINTRDVGSTHRDDRPGLTHSSDGGSLSDKSSPRKQAKTTRKRFESVKLDINGKTREFFPPTQHQDVNGLGSKPDQKLKLDWVYGYRGRDVKQNLAVLPTTGDLVYFVGAVGIVYNRRLSTQQHYLGHSEEITCLAVHPNGRFVATGQISGPTPDSAAHVRIWDGRSLATVAVVGLGSLHLGVACLNFSERVSHVRGGIEETAGDLLMVIDESDKHVLSVWEWQSETLVARTTTTSDPVVSGCFYSFDDSLLLTYGKGHIHFWRLFLERGRKIMRDKLSGNLQNQAPKFLTSVCFSSSGDVITGDSSGAILVWSCDSNHVFTVNAEVSAQTRTAHKKSVSTLCMLGDGTLLSGGGSSIKAWDSVNNYSLVKERSIPQSAGHVRTIVPVNSGGLDGSIYIGTTKNKVLEGSLQLKFKVIIQGHVEELWALDSHFVEQSFVSAGHDQMVVKWSAVSHSPVWRANVESPCTSISLDPRGRLVALGTTSGRIVVLNSQTGDHLTTLPSGTVQINALSFSPDGKQLAVGTFDGQLQIFHVQEDGLGYFRPQASALQCSNTFVMHVDWSVDSKYIQVVMGDYQLVYWNTTNMQKILWSRNMRDVEWATHNCPIGHSVVGPWKNLDQGDVINVVSRSQSKDLLVAGDTRGRLRLYRWPCSAIKAGFRQTKVYSSNVTCSTFTSGDGYLITSGGNDAALMQFSVLDRVTRR